MRAAAAGVEPLVGRDVVAAGASHRADGAAQREHHLWFARHLQVTRGRDPAAQELKAGVEQVDERCHRRQQGPPSGRAEAVVGKVPVELGGKGQQGELFLGLLTILNMGVAQRGSQSCGEPLAQFPLERHPATDQIAVVGFEPLAVGGGVDDQVLPWAQHVGLEQARGQRLDRLRSGRLDAEALARAEDVAMLPVEAPAGAKVGLVVELGADCPGRPLAQVVVDGELVAVR